MMLNNLEELIKERKSSIREFALEAKREGFGAIGLFEFREESSKRCDFKIERFINIEVASSCYKNELSLVSAQITDLEDPYALNLLESAITAKDVLQQYSYEKKRRAMLEFDKHQIESRDIVKVTNYNPGVGRIGVEDKYSARIEKINIIEEELMSLNYSIGRVEKGLELVRDENEIGCEAMVLKHVHNDSYEAIALELSCSRRHVITKIKEAEELLEKIMK